MPESPEPPEQEPITESTAIRLGDLLAQNKLSQSGSESASRESWWWTDEELAAARNAARRHLVAHDFEPQPDGTYAKGSGRRRVAIRPTALMPLRFPGEKGYNPRLHAFALRLGAEFIEYGQWVGKYRLGSLILDHLGAALDTEACPGCGSKKGEVDYHLSVLRESHNPFRKPWEQAWTYCRVCTPEEERQRFREAANQPAEPKKKPKGQQGSLHYLQPRKE